MTVGEIYDYNIGDVFIRAGGYWAPPAYEKTIVTDKHFSSLLDTVFYTFDIYTYTAPSCSSCASVYDTTYGIHIFYSQLTDTVGVGLGTPPHYWSANCIDTAGYNGFWVDSSYYDSCNILSTRISVMDNGPQLIDSCYSYFEPHWGYDEYGKGLGKKYHYYNSCSEGGNCEFGSWMIFYKKGNDSCGTAPFIPAPTNIDELNSSNSFVLFPNPSNGIFSVKNIYSKEKYFLKIFNSLGLLVYSEQFFNNHEYKIDLDIEKGIYVAVLIVAEKSIAKKLIIE
jgi:hypothetical protein